MKNSRLLDEINNQYMELHKNREDLFWSSYMSLGATQSDFLEAEKKWRSFISDKTKLDEIRTEINQLKQEPQKQEDLQGLMGWEALFSANSVESIEAEKLQEKMLRLTAELFEKKRQHSLHYTNEAGERVEAGLSPILVAVRTSSNEDVRKSAHGALLDLEKWVLENGFLELVKVRNQFARSMGYENYFDFVAQKVEHMSSEELFSILSKFELDTREANGTAKDRLRKEKGESALEGHNYAYSYAGDAVRSLDPYFSFSRSVDLWIRSFSRMNIGYRGAKLSLDLLDREGKYQNGFCHAPVPSYFDRDRWVPAQINFTSNARPDQVGSGFSALATLFHEGGHAAHFANVQMNAPCFSQEFLPTSMAYAETQSMFLDSLLGDADWLARYGEDKEGNPIPEDVIQGYIEAKQPAKAFSERSILVVPWFERKLYSLSDEALTPERVLDLARETEKEILGVEVSPRPLLAIPHLLSDDAACTYQGYLLAHMAVYQTRAWFFRNQGHICDNPEVGPLLAKHYWRKGNAQTHDESLRSLTGEGFNPRYLAEHCSKTADEAWKTQLELLSNHKKRQKEEESSPSELDAIIKIVNGKETLATNQKSDAELSKDFTLQIRNRFGR